MKVYMMVEWKVDALDDTRAALTAARWETKMVALMGDLLVVSMVARRESKMVAKKASWLVVSLVALKVSWLSSLDFDPNVD